MTLQTPPSLPRREKSSTLLERAIVAVTGSIFLCLLGLLLLSLTFQLYYLGRIFPGVHVAGIDLSGVRRTEAADQLSQHASYPDSGLIALEGSGGSWVFSPREMGLILDIEETAQEAYKVGRSGWPWTRIIEQITAVQKGIYLSPIMLFDGRQAQLKLEQVAAQVNRPTIEASLAVDGIEVVAVPGQVGLILDINETLKRVEAQLRTMSDGVVQVSMIERPPMIMDVSGQAELARRIISQPLTLTVPNAAEEDAGPWKFNKETLASMLEVVRVKTENGEQYQLELDPADLRNILEPLVEVLALEPRNARFVFNDDTRQLEVIQNAVIGRELLVEESIERINRELINGSHNIDLVFDLTEPVVTDDSTGEELGVTELVSSQTTYFYGSSAERIQNIQAASSRFHGLLIPPGSTFSMVSELGDISLDTGYAEALIIYGDRTIKGVGGGVCQVSTTLFRTVFFGGFPVVERYSHAYRVYYYELNASGGKNEKMAGLDATVYAPLIDFKFTNDTPYWLLMETYVDVAGRSLTWKFYSTSDGREVEWDTSGLEDIEDPPKPVYEEDEELKVGEIKQVDWAVEGADVTVTRTVTRDGEVLFQDEFKTHYEPWATVCHYGPHTQNYPPPEKKQDIYSCKVLEKDTKKSD